MNDHDTDAIEVDSPSRHSRRSRTPRHRIRLSAEDAARVQREAWSDVEPAKEKLRGSVLRLVFVQSSPRHLLPFWTSRILCCTLNKTQGCVIISNQLHKLT